ncbi:MAG: DUF1003 domain-containing protein [archaeon]
MKKEGTIPRVIHGQRTFGEKAADKLATWAGSWGFIISFLLLLVLWIAVNIYAWINVWDPYPFILLNLVLSCIAALQAPVILMSQNRQSQKDRQKAEYDYRVNRRAMKGIEEIFLRLESIEDRLGMIKVGKKKISRK